MLFSFCVAYPCRKECLKNIYLKWIKVGAFYVLAVFQVQFLFSSCCLRMFCKVKRRFFHKELQLSRYNYGTNITEMCFGFGIQAFSLSSTQTDLPSPLLVSL